MQDFTGKIVLVTGGGKGVGRAIVHEFARHGAHVLINYFHSQPAAEATLAEVLAEGGSAELIRATVAKQDSVDSMFTAIRDRHGRLDVLVNNAARGVLAAADTVTDQDWTKVFEVNVHGARRCSWAALPLLPSGTGTIVNVSSIGAGMVLDNYAAVGVSKAALEALTRYLAVEFGPRAVRVNVASAGLLDNPTARLFPAADSFASTCVASAPLGRLGTEQELARLVTFLASPQSSWITGQTLLADGGLSLGHAMLRGDHRPTAAKPAEPARTPPKESAGEDLIAVVGMGLVVPGATSTDEFWSLLQRGEDVFDEPRDRYRADRFRSPDSSVEDRAYSCRGGFIREPALHPAAAAAGPDMAARWLRHAVAQAYVTVTTSQSDRVAAYMGMTVDGNQAFEESVLVEVTALRMADHWPHPDDRATLLDRLREQLRAHYPHATHDPAAHTPEAVIRTAIAGLLPADTPFVAVDTACSSSLYSVDLGAKSLLAGDADIAVCGGVYNLAPRYAVEFSKLRGLSRQGHVRSFGTDADGTLFSDGAATVVLKRLDRARRDGDAVLAVLGGFGAASDGRGKAIYAPNATGQDRALRRAREAGGVAPEEVDWVIAHSTGTPVGDRVETEVLAGHSSEQGHLCTSTKSIIGHTGWAAGAVSLIHGILGLRHSTVPAQAPLDSVRPELDGTRITVPLEHTPLPRRADRPRTVGVSSFGFGGTNAHQIIRDEPRPGQVRARSGPGPQDNAFVLLAWSAHLPGGPSREDLLHRAASGQPLTDQASFGVIHPPLPADAARLAPSTVRTVDRTQLMALAVAHKFATEHGPLWDQLRETTGVFTAHTGACGVLGDVTMRCYRDDLVNLPVTKDGVDPGAWKHALSKSISALCVDRPATDEDTMSGHMPNIISARIASQLDLHGPAITLDSGMSSTHFAMHAACQYLATGEIDLALVLALNGATAPETAVVTGVPHGRLTEGAFLFAVARAADAARYGWPVLGRISTRPRSEQRHPLPPRARTYLAADGAVDVIGALAKPGPAVIPGAEGAPAVMITPQHARPVLPANPVTTRHVPFWERQPSTGTALHTTAPPGCVLLTDGKAIGLRTAEATVVTIGPDDDPRAVVDRLPEPIEHLRVIVTGDGHSSWPTATAPGILRLQETMFLAAQRDHRRLRDSGSIGVAIVDEFRGGTPAAHSGLFTGFVKSMSWEFPHCTSRAVITDSSSADAWRELETEINQSGGLPVTVYRGGVRYRQRLKDDPGELGPPPLRPGSVVVATGGARGITGAVVEGLARCMPLNIWLIGSSALEDVPSDLVHAADKELPKFRAAFISEGLAASKPVPVAELNRRFDRLVRAREACLTLDRLRAFCGDAAVHYLTADVNDADAVRRAAEAIAAEHDSVDLLINGAGLHHPGDIERKTLEGFRNIRDVKLFGYHNLKKSFRNVKLWCNFGSVTGLVGLPGEAEYSPANDFLAHAAQYEHAVRGRDEYTIAWTVWDEVGLGAGELAQGLVGRTRRLSSMPKDEGVAHFVAELGQQGTRDTLVTFIGEREQESFARLFPGYQVRETGGTGGYFLKEPVERGDDEVSWRLVVDPDDERYLGDHTVDGTPTMPGTMLAAIAAEAARYFAPHAPVGLLRDLSFQVWVRGHRAREYQVAATRFPDPSGETSVLVRLTSQQVMPDGRLLNEREHFRATVVAGRPYRRMKSHRQNGDRTTAVFDPYYQHSSPVRLTAAFQSTEDWKAGPLGTTALWRPDPDALPDVFGRLAIPSLLLDALARCESLQSVDGVHRVLVPRYIRRIELTSDSNDIALAKQHPDGIEVRWDRPAGQWCATAPDGSVIARIEDMRCTPVGQVEEGEQTWS